MKLSTSKSKIKKTTTAAKISKKYSVYILRCKDDSLYTGITNDIEKRIHAHNFLKSGAKYTKTRRPVRLMYSKICKTKSEAMKREFIIKKMSKSDKEKILK